MVCVVIAFCCNCFWLYFDFNSAKTMSHLRARFYSLKVSLHFPSLPFLSLYFLSLWDRVSLCSSVCSWARQAFQLSFLSAGVPGVHHCKSRNDSRKNRQPRTTLNSWSFCVHLTSARMTKVPPCLAEPSDLMVFFSHKERTFSSRPI